MYKLKTENTSGIYNENVECGHLVCNEPSTLRLNNIFVESSSYVFQMKIKSNITSKVTVLIGNQEKEILSSASWKCSVLKFEEVTNTQQYIELTFSAGEYWFYNVQLETGNVQSDWRESSGDTEFKISEFKQDINGFKQTVSEKYETKEDANTKLSKVETSISNNSNEISLKASTESVTELANKTNETDKALSDAKTLIQKNMDAIATLTSRDFKVEFTTITNQIEKVNGDLTAYKNEVGNWMRFDASGNLVLGATRVAGQDAYELKLTKNRISFMLNDNEVAYISSNQLYITNSTVVQNLKIGGFTWEVRGNGNMGLVWR